MTNPRHQDIEVEVETTASIPLNEVFEQVDTETLIAELERRDYPVAGRPGDNIVDAALDGNADRVLEIAADQALRNCGRRVKWNR